MHVANLQLEGLLMAVAAVNDALVKSGALSAEAVDTALRKAEAALSAEERAQGDLTASNREATCFPIRLLRHANRAAATGALPPFSELARMVGRSKQPHNDQM